MCIWWWHSLAARLTVFQSFLLSLKQQQNLMKIMFSCICFPVWPHPPKIMEKKKKYFILVNCICVNIWITLFTVLLFSLRLATLSNAMDIIYIMVSQTTYKWLLKLWLWILSIYIYQNQTEWSENVFELKLYCHAPCSSPDFAETHLFNFNLVSSKEMHLMKLNSLTNQLHTLVSMFGHKWKTSSKW